MRLHATLYFLIPTGMKRRPPDGNSNFGTSRRREHHALYRSGRLQTPMGSSMVPVPYMSMVSLGSSVRTSRTVRNNGQQDFQLNSRALVVTGHEPGIGKGVKVSGYKSHALAKKGSKTVFF